MATKKSSKVKRKSNTPPSSPRFPKTVTVLGKRLKVILKKNLRDHDTTLLYGMYVSNESAIYICDSLKLEDRQLTLFHEMTHAALDISGIKYLFPESPDIEEAIVRMMESFAYSLVDVKKLK